MQTRPDGLVMLAVTRTLPEPPGQESGIQMLDLSDPSEPGVSEFLAVEGLAPFGLAIALDGEQAWVAYGDTLRSFDLSDPLDPVPGPVLEGLEHEPVRGMAFDEGLLHVFGEQASWSLDDHGLWIYQADDLWELTFSGFHQSAADCPAGGVTARNGLVALVCSHSTGIWHFVDVGDPANPVFLGEYDADSGRGLSAWLAEDELVWLGSWGGVDLVDLSDPSTPRLINRYFLGGRAVSLSGEDSMVIAATTTVRNHGGGLARLELPAPVASAHTAACYDPLYTGQGFTVHHLDSCGEIIAKNQTRTLCTQFLPWAGGLTCVEQVQLTGLTETDACVDFTDSGGPFITADGQAQGITVGGNVDIYNPGYNCSDPFEPNKTSWFQPIRPVVHDHDLVLLSAHGPNAPTIHGFSCPNAFQSGEGMYVCDISHFLGQGTEVQWTGSTGHSASNMNLLVGFCASHQTVNVNLTVSSPYGSDQRNAQFTCPTGPIP